MGNLHVRFLEGWAPAMAPGYSTVMVRSVLLDNFRIARHPPETIRKPQSTPLVASCSGALFENSRSMSGNPRRSSSRKSS